MRRGWLLAVVGAFLALQAIAGEHDAAYYQRTGTKAPVQGEFMLGPSFHYSYQLSPGVSFGYAWKKTGIVLVGDFSAMRVDAQTGEVPFQVGCKTYQVPFDTGTHTRGQVSVSLLVPLRKYAQAAK